MGWGVGRDGRGRSEAATASAITQGLNDCIANRNNTLGVTRDLIGTSIDVTIKRPYRSLLRVAKALT